MRATRNIPQAKSPERGLRGRVNDFRMSNGLEAGHRSVKMVRRNIWEGTLLRENRACKLAL